MKNVFTIFSKELTVFIRDKRTLINTFVIPIVFYLIFFNVMTMMAAKQIRELKTKTVKVGFTKNISSNIVAYISKNSNHLSFLKINKIENPEKILKEKKLNVILDFKDKTLTLYYNAAKKLSREGKKRLLNLLEEYKKEVVRNNLKNYSIPEELVNPFEIEEDNIASSKDLGIAFLGRLMPYLIIIMLFSGALGFGLEVTTGEKEKGTIATLLVSQASRTEIVLGKLLYVIFIEIVYSLVNIAGFMFAAATSTKNITKDLTATTIKEAIKHSDKVQQISFSMDVKTFLIIFLLILPIGLISGALIIALGSYAKSMKEGQTLMTPIFLVIIFVALLTMNAPIKVPNYYFFIPILNTAFSMQEVLMGKIVLSHLILSLGTTTLLAAFLVALSVYLFNRESILFRT